MPPSKTPPESAALTVYGADWCSMTQQVLEQLDSLKVTYKYIDIDHDKDAAHWVSQQNNGKEKKPTLHVDGNVIVEPDLEELEDYLRRTGLLKA